MSRPLPLPPPLRDVVHLERDVEGPDGWDRVAVRVVCQWDLECGPWIEEATCEGRSVDLTPAEERRALARAHAASDERRAEAAADRARDRAEALLVIPEFWRGL